MNASTRLLALAVVTTVATAFVSAANAASFTFPTFNIPAVTPTETAIVVPGTAPALTYDQYTFTVNWSEISGTPWSNEARFRLFNGSTNYVGGATPTSGIAASTGALTNGNPTTLTWTGDLASAYTGGNPLTVGARQTFAGSSAAWNNATLTVSQSIPVTGGNYSIDDGTAEDSIGVNGAAPFDLLWLNRFAVQDGGEIIESVQIAFGSPANDSTGVVNGLPVEVLLYEDVNGGSPTDAVLLATVNGTTQSVNSNTFVSFDMPDTEVQGTLLVGAVVRNLPGGEGFIAGIDQTDPDLNNRSYLGFTSGASSPLNASNLASIGANFGSTDSFGLAGNFLVRATGRAVPEPTTLAALSLGGLLLRRRRVA